jgi:hypothetical protein
MERDKERAEKMNSEKKKLMAKISVVALSCLVGLLLILFSLNFISRFATTGSFESPSERGAYYSPGASNDSVRSMDSLQAQNGMESSEDYGQEQMLVTTNYLQIETDDVDDTIDSLEEMVDEYDGQITNKNITLGDHPGGTVQIKMPETHADAFLDTINEKFKLSSYNVSVSDETEIYSTREQDIALLEEKIKLYRDLEAQTSIENIDTRISILDRIADYESRIEFLTEQNEGLEKDTRYRNISMGINSSPQVQGERNYWEITGQMAVDAFQNSLRIFLVIIITSLPFLVLVGIVVIVVKIYRKNFNRGKDDSR